MDQIKFIIILLWSDKRKLLLLWYYYLFFSIKNTVQPFLFFFFLFSFPFLWTPFSPADYAYRTARRSFVVQIWQVHFFSFHIWRALPANHWLLLSTLDAHSCSALNSHVWKPGGTSNSYIMLWQWCYKGRVVLEGSVDALRIWECRNQQIVQVEATWSSVRFLDNHLQFHSYSPAWGCTELIIMTPPVGSVGTWRM